MVVCISAENILGTSRERRNSDVVFEIFTPTEAMTIAGGGSFIALGVVGFRPDASADKEAAAIRCSLRLRPHITG